MSLTRTLCSFLLLTTVFSFSQDDEATKNKGKLSGQWRTYYMNTFNNGGLKDFAALATGGKLKYQYSFGSRFKIGAALYNSTNLGIQDLTLPDATTNKLGRYEEGLFDRLDLENDAIFLLGELYLNYKLSAHEITLGRMKLNTPLINPEDGRMIPTLVQGAWYAYTSKVSNVIKLGVFNRIAPRSTSEFFRVGESIGTYPEGRNIDGKTHQYYGNTNSDFLALFNTDVKISKKIQLNFWNFYVDNVTNSAYLKPKMQLNTKWALEAEWLHQNRVGDGGNSLDSLRYFTSNTSDIVGVKLGYQHKRTKVSLAYDHILANGQFIFPREWGREDLFSFQKRERSEGSGDNHALVFYYDTQIELVPEQAKIQSILSVGKHWKPTLTDAVLNKYAMPSYTQINLDLYFKFDNLKHLQPELLLVSKIGQGDIPHNPNFYLNKVDMFHVDLILNYNF
ncbi:MAG: OprD family outer membrane porin [Flavobacteriaceae bacterium]